jgi:hypothetical protein
MHLQLDNPKILSSLIIALGLTCAVAWAATPLGTTFSYQGRLTQSGNAVNGDADLQISLWDGPDPAPGNSSQIGNTRSSTVPVTEGIFSVDLNFGDSAFTGDERWLEIAVRFPTGSGTFITLTPRQRINAAPYALAMLGRFTQPNELSPNLIGGFAGNTVSPNVFGATISGGGEAGAVNTVTSDHGTVGGGHSNSASIDSTVAGGANNSASGDTTTIGGGKDNIATNFLSTIGGGSSNTASGASSTVGGGVSNMASGDASTIGGGFSNTANATRSTVGGGVSNLASASESTVGGGSTNTANGPSGTVAGGFSNSSSAFSATVGGGGTNIASSNGSTVAGGFNNTASGFGSAIPGGQLNVAAGQFSFAAGRRAKANHNGAFVWGDSTDANVSSIATNTFTARAVNGFIFYTNSGLTSGAAMGAGAGSWTSLSDRNRKRDIKPIDAQDILAKVVTLPITSWSYDSQDSSVRHIGPMAQDFNPAFGIGEFEDGITTIDADGVALAAIQGLHHTLTEEVSRLRNTTTAQATELADLKSQLDELRTLLESRRPIERNNASTEQ